MRLPLFVLMLAMTLPLCAWAGDCDAHREVVIRDTTSRHAVDGDRHRPLTSTFLDTTSTRLVDARRGFRPYDTVHAPDRYRARRTHRRSYGLHSRRRGRSYCRPSVRRTGVTAYRGNSAARDNDRDAQPTAVVYIQDNREAQDAPQAEPVAMEVTIYEGEPVMPEHSGAVIVRKDGTVISIGD